MKIKRRLILFVATVIVAHLIFPLSTFAAMVSFQGLGVGTKANDVSADGKVVVGVAGTQAFRWTATEGLQDLGQGKAYGVSGDGSVIVGDSGDEACRWTADNGMVRLGFLPGSYKNDNSSRACGVSDDGSTVVGWSRCLDYYFATCKRPFLWTADGGMINISGGYSMTWASEALAVSDEGSVVVGWGYPSACGPGFHMISPGGQEAFRWTADDGMMGLGELDCPTSLFSGSCAKGLSDDGSVVVGSCNNESCRWTADDGMISIGFRGSADDVSGDGSIVVGCSYDFYSEAFLWTEELGIVSIKDMLEDQYNLDLSGWMLNRVTGISDDGLTIVGYDTNPNGLTEGWVATIPEPSTFLLISLGIALLSKRR